MRKIYFRADASSAIGYGHFIRTLALADMLKEDFDCTFFTCHPTPYQIGEMEKVCPHVTLQEETHYDQFLSYLQGDEIVVLDNYFFTTDYQRAIKQKGCKLVCIDDMHDKHYVADVVINQFPYDGSLFSKEAETKLCLGFDWFLLRKEFLSPINVGREKDYDIVVCLGGADPYKITNRIIDLLLKLRMRYSICIIAGDRVEIDFPPSSKLQLFRNLSADELADVFDRSRLAVTSASTICIEALSRKMKIIGGYYVDNQKSFYDYLVSSNLIIGIECFLDLNADKLHDALLSAEETKFAHIGILSNSVRYIKLFRLL